MVFQICRNFELLFETQDEEGDETDADNGEDTTVVPTDERGTNPYGYLPYILTYVRVTATNINDTLRESAMQVLWVVQYELERQRKEDEAIKRAMRR